MKHLKTLLLLVISINSTAEVTEQVDFEYYYVYGQSMKELTLSMKENSPVIRGNSKHAATVKLKIQYRYSNHKNTAGCSLINPEVRLKTTYVIPKIIEERSSTRIITVFKEYSSRLMKHEREHRNIAFESAQQLDKSLALLPLATDCASLKRNTRTLYSRINEDQKRRNQIYDKETQHGVLQGVSFMDIVKPLVKTRKELIEF